VRRAPKVWQRVGLGGALLVLLALAAPVRAQEQVQPTGVIVVPLGHSVVVTHPDFLERILLTDPEIADAVVISGNEVVLNGTQIGATTLMFWGEAGTRAAYFVRVVPDVQYLQEELDRLYPGIPVRVTAAGNAIILTGELQDAQLAGRVLRLAGSLAAGAEVVDYIAVPDRAQILLQVRLAEVSRSAVQQLGATLLRIDPTNLRGDDEIGVGPGTFSGSFPGSGPSVTFSDAVNFYLFHSASNVAAFIQALRNEGAFRSLAEPNLLAFPGEEASFLAGGEFPFPSATGATQATSIEFKEFGIRLNFTPEITNSGAIRLQVAPEVSQLDFGRGLVIAGFSVPSLLTRRAQTVVELQEGQTFAIAGLMDNQMSETVSKIPLLGDIPIIGTFFRSREVRDSQTELLVLVTPHLVYPRDVPPALPTGEIQDWNRDRLMLPVSPPAVPPTPWDSVPPGGGGSR